jgi:hypothetical protein
LKGGEVLASLHANKLVGFAGLGLKRVGIFKIRSVRVAGAALLVILGLLLVGVQPAAANHIPFGTGDVFAGVGNGKINHYSPSGTLLEVLDTGTNATDPPANEAGMCFDLNGNLYATDWDAYQMTKFNNKGGVVNNPWGRTFSTTPETCVVTQGGDAVYVGTAQAEPTLYKRDLAGNPTGQFTLAVDDYGIDWIDLAPDQCTIYYTSYGDKVKRFNVCTNTQLSDFASGLPAHNVGCFQVALRPNGEVLVACDTDIVRLNSSGSIIQSYNPGSESEWYTLQLDPDGVSFWAAAFSNGHIYKVDIASGAVSANFTATPGPGAGLAGLGVYSPPPYAHPLGASPLRASLVPTFRPCETTAANSRHGGPLNFTSCHSPQPNSSTVTVGRNSLGFVRWVVCPAGTTEAFCNPSSGTLPKPDVRLTGSIRDVKCLSSVPPGCSAGADYNPNNATGPYTSTGDGASAATPPCFPSGSSSTACIASTDVTEVATIPGATTGGSGTNFQGNGVRITDQNNTAPRTSATVVDLGFPIPMDCLPTTDTSRGSTCGVNTTMNALAPGVVVAGKAGVWRIGEIQVRDSGPDGTRGNSDDQVFESQGIFVP